MGPGREHGSATGAGSVLATTSMVVLLVLGTTSTSIMWRSCSDDEGGLVGLLRAGLGAGAGETNGVNMSESRAPEALRRAAVCDDSAWAGAVGRVGEGASFGLGGAREVEQLVGSMLLPLPSVGLEWVAARGSVSWDELGRCPAVGGRCWEKADDDDDEAPRSK